MRLNFAQKNKRKRYFFVMIVRDFGFNEILNLKIIPQKKGQPKDHPLNIFKPSSGYQPLDGYKLPTQSQH